MNHKNRQLRTLPLLVSALLAGVLSNPYKVWAQAKLDYFDLPGQALQLSLIEFGVQAGVNVLADSQLLVGQQSSPVVGPLTPEAALRGLLAKSGLTFRYDSKAASYVIARTQPARDEPAVQQLQSPPPVAVPHVEELLVHARALPFRYQTIQHSQVLGDVAYFDSSRFLNVIPQTLVADAHPREIADVLTLASSITPGDGLGDSNDDVYIRGFQRHALYLDGFRLSDSTGLKVLPENIEQADILKGPSTLFYGQAEPGGIINLERKHPRDTDFVSAKLGVGDLGQQLLALDINQAQAPLLKQLAWRVNLVDQAQDKSAEINDIHRQLAAVSLDWKVTAATSLAIAYEYQRDQQDLLSHLQVIDDPTGTVPDAFLDDLAPVAKKDFSTVGHFFSADLTHYINDDWSVKLQYFWRDENRAGVRANLDTLLKTNVLFSKNELGNDFILYSLGSRAVIPIIVTPSYPEWLYRIAPVTSLYGQDELETNNNGKLRIDGTWESGYFVHHIAVGAEWYRQDLYKNYTLEHQDKFGGRVWTASELDAEIYNILNQVIYGAALDTQYTNRELRLLYDDYGIFAQDVVELGESWTFTLGGRYSSLRGDHTDITQASATQLQSYNHFSGQLGLVYKPVDSQSVYLNYSQALRANYHLDDVGSLPAQPELSDQIELGLKSLWFDGALMSTLGIYQIDKRNVVDIEILDGLRTSLNGIEARAQGVDLDLTWQLKPGLDVLAGMSLLKPEITSGENQGNRLPLAAAASGSLFIRYSFTNGVALTLGGKYVGERYADNTNQFAIDPYTTLDMGVSGSEELWGQEVNWHLGVNNILDKSYYTAVVASSNINTAQGRSIAGSLQVKW